MWRFDNGAYTLRLTPETTLSLKPSGDRYAVSLITADGTPFFSVDIDNGDEGHVIVQQIHNELGKGFSGPMLSEIMKVLTSGEIVGSEPSTQFFPQPPSPSEEQTKRFFSKIQGDWHLSSPRAVEDVHIDPEGRYQVYLLGPKKLGANYLQDRYRLFLLACDSDLSKVELAKKTLDGQTFQIEVLNVGSDKMEGVAKHDQHHLLYTKR